MNTYKKTIKLSIAALLISCSVVAQQDAMYTHYAFNTLNVNPGYAGSRGVASATLLHRSQWVGFEGAPTTQTLTLHSPVFKESFGTGLSVINDNIGPLNTTSFYLDLSYKLRITQAAKLAVGIKGGGNFIQNNLNNVSTQSSDPSFFGISNSFNPNIGAGAYLYKERWYLGFSAPRFMENSFTSNGAGGVEGEKRHYFFIAGYISKAKHKVQFKPTMFIKATESAPIEADLTAMFVLDKKLELGIMGRTGDALGALIGYNFTNQLRVGYSFDWSFVNATGRYNAGSHEVMLRYDLINPNKDKIHSPRYF